MNRLRNRVYGGCRESESRHCHKAEDGSLASVNQLSSKMSQIIGPQILLSLVPELY